MGEEAYSLVLIWDRTVGNDFPQLDIQVIGSDIDEVLAATRNACLLFVWQRQGTTGHMADSRHLHNTKRILS